MFHVKHTPTPLGLACPAVVSREEAEAEQADILKLSS